MLLTCLLAFTVDSGSEAGMTMLYIEFQGVRIVTKL